MPFYEYRCDACGHELEAMQKISDPALTDCPSCKQPTLKKRISAVGFRLKGSGWYETDFKQSKQKNLHDAGDKPASGEAASDKADAKPESSGADGAKAGSDKTSSAAPAKPAESRSAA